MASIWRVSRAARRKAAPLPLDQAQLLRRVARDPLVRTYVGKSPLYSTGGVAVPERLALALIRARVLLPVEPGLPDEAQSWRLRRREDDQ